jgi:hypothetical protein
MAAAGDTDFDIFISYADPDNRLPAPLDRWVERLARDLPSAVQFHLKRLPRIYFDADQAEINKGWDHVETCCKRARILVAIVSPNYLERDWPLRELNAYVAAQDTLDGLFVVALSKIAPDAHPVLGQRTHLPCYDRRPNLSDEDAFPISPSSEAFQDLLLKLAASISRRLRQLSSDAAPAPVPIKAPTRAAIPPRTASQPGEAGVSVLLAQPTEDLESECEAVRDYLTQFGIEVMPRAEYPLGGGAFQEAFAADLAKASHVIQLLGPRPGRRPPDLPEGYVVHQCEAARAAGKTLLQWRSVNWQIPDTADPAYQALLKGETVAASTLEEFKAEARRCVTAPPPAAGGVAKKGFMVFINAERADRAAAERLRAELPEYSIFHPDYDADGSNQEEVIAQLRECRALLLLYGEAGLNWVNRQMLEAIKHRGDSLPGGAVCLGPPAEKRPLNFRVPDIVELNCRDGDNWALEPIRRRLAELSR